ERRCQEHVAGRGAPESGGDGTLRVDAPPARGGRPETFEGLNHQVHEYRGSHAGFAREGATEAEAAQRETKTHALEAKIQELNDHVVATETRLAEALVTEAKALHDIEGVREDRFEYEILAAEAAERSDGMRAEKNLAFKTAQDAGKKLDVCTASLAASEGQVTALTKEN
ncbi:unnamed protein product, partial [Sphacelaria rigidula]